MREQIWHLTQYVLNTVGLGLLIIIVLAIILLLTSNYDPLLSLHERYRALCRDVRHSQIMRETARAALCALLVTPETRESLALAIVKYSPVHIPVEKVREFLNDEATEAETHPFMVYFHGERLEKLLKLFDPSDSKPTPNTAPAD